MSFHSEWVHLERVKCSTDAFLKCRTSHQIHSLFSVIRHCGQTWTQTLIFSQNTIKKNSIANVRLFPRHECARKTVTIEKDGILCTISIDRVTHALNAALPSRVSNKSQAVPQKQRKDELDAASNAYVLKRIVKRIGRGCNTKYAAPSYSYCTKDSTVEPASHNLK